MLSFAPKQIDKQTLLKNTTAISKFSPHSSHHNSLTLTTNGCIQVTTREITPPKLYEIFAKLSLTGKENKEAFAQEKMILIWHFSQLMPYLESRFIKIKNLSKGNLQQYYQYSMRLQGFYQLCNNLVLQLARFNDLMQESENPQKAYWTTEFGLLQKNLTADLEQTLKLARNFVQEITRQRKDGLSHEVPVLAINFNHEIHLQQIHRPMPIKFMVGKINYDGHEYFLKAHLEAYRATWDNPTRYPFTGKVAIEVIDGDQYLCPTLKVYPSLIYGEYPIEAVQKDVHFPADCANNLLWSRYEQCEAGSVTMTPVTLRASFSSLCFHVKSSDLLPYFLTLIDIAKTQRIPEITVFATYDYSAILCAYGFYIDQRDKYQPTHEEQMQVVNTSFGRGRNVPVMAEPFNRETDKHEPILRAFHFSLNEIATRVVFIPKRNLKTTYEKLLAQTKVIDGDNYPDGIIPEVHQIPIKMVLPRFTQLRQRELTGKLEKPSVHYGLRPVNYEILDQDDQLQSYACADPIAAKESGHQRMLQLIRK